MLTKNMTIEREFINQSVDGACFASSRRQRVVTQF
jgi:hypothetical protein